MSDVTVDMKLVSTEECYICNWAFPLVPSELWGFHCAELVQRQLVLLGYIIISSL